jgi:multidrug efflux pump subunit AcrB
VRVQANPAALSAYGLTLEDLRVAVVAATFNQAKGSFGGPRPSSGRNREGTVHGVLLTRGDGSSSYAWRVSGVAGRE